MSSKIKVVFIFMLLSCVAGQSGAFDAFWAPPVPPLAQYQINARIDVDQGMIEGSETISFTNTTARPMKRLVLYWIALGTLNISHNEQPVTVLDRIEDNSGNAHTHIALAESVLPGESLVLDLTFRLEHPGLIQINKVEIGSVFPYLWWGFDTKDDYDVRIDVSKDYLVATSARLNHETGRYQTQGVRSFGLFLGRGFQSLEARAGDVNVSCIFAPDGRDCARLLLDTAVDAINFYRERFGFYPARDLAIIPGMDRPAGGYPVATNLVAIHGMARMREMPMLHWQWITAHEIGHQYFGEYVLEKDNPGWLWIGLGIYADQQYTQARALDPDKHQAHLTRYRDGMRSGYDTTVARSAEQMEQIDFDFNSVVIHGKGFTIISALDCILGKQVFSRIVDRCLSEYAYLRLGEYEFRAVCESESGQDLGWFFDQWVHSNRYLSYEITETQCTKTRTGYCTQVTVKKLGTMDFPVPVQATFADGSTQDMLTERLLSESIVTFVSAAPLQQATIDPEGKLAMIVPPL